MTRGADFYASDIDTLRKEGEISLEVSIEICEEDGIESGKDYSGRFNLMVQCLRQRASL